MITEKEKIEQKKCPGDMWIRRQIEKSKRRNRIIKKNQKKKKEKEE